MVVKIKKSAKKASGTGAEYAAYFDSKTSVSPIKGHKSISKHASGQMVHEQHSESKVAETGFIPPHLLAQVYVSGSHTVNLGNFESAKITVGVNMPCHKDEIVSTYQFASDWVSKQLENAMAEVKNNGDNG